MGLCVVVVVACVSAGRKRFDSFIRTEMAQMGFRNPFPDTGLIYDYLFSMEQHKWVPWMQSVDPYVFNSKLSFAELIIPTKDSVRYKFLAKTLLTNSKFVLMAGPTGTRGHWPPTREVLGVRCGCVVHRRPCCCVVWRL